MGEFIHKKEANEKKKKKKHQTPVHASIARHLTGKNKCWTQVRKLNIEGITKVK